MESITSVGEIGFFKVYYGITLGASPRPALLTYGCSPANLHLSGSEVLNNWRYLPRVRCTEKLPRHDHVSVIAPLEFPPQGGGTARITGHATGTQWLIAFQDTKFRQKGCQDNALRESLRTGWFSERPVHGRFVVRVRTAPATTSSFLCVYLQSARAPGGRVRVTGITKPLPDGRVIATANWFFLAGDRVSISAPPTATAGQTVSFTVVGHTEIPEWLYVFAQSIPCRATAQAELMAGPNQYGVKLSFGDFSKQLTVSVPSSSPPPILYLCGYLTNAPDSDVLSSTLATGSAQLAIPPPPALSITRAPRTGVRSSAGAPSDIRAGR